MPNNIITVDERNFYEHMTTFINRGQYEIHTLDDIKMMYIKMLENEYFFIIPHELKLNMMIDLTYKLNQTQDNRINVLDIFSISEDENESDDDRDSIYVSR